MAKKVDKLDVVGWIVTGAGIVISVIGGVITGKKSQRDINNAVDAAVAKALPPKTE